MDNESIVRLIDSMEKESKAIKDDILRLCWYMRGSISYDDAMMLSYNERLIIGKIIEDNMETTKKTQLPFF